MSPTDQHSDGRREDRYCLIFLNSIPGRTLSPEVVNLHAAHLAELDTDGKLVLGGPIPERAGGLIVVRTGSLAEARGIAPELTARQNLFPASVALIEALDGGWDTTLTPTQEQLQKEFSVLPQLNSQLSVGDSIQTDVLVPPPSAPPPVGEAGGVQ